MPGLGNGRIFAVFLAITVLATYGVILWVMPSGAQPGGGTTRGSTNQQRGACAANETEVQAFAGNQNQTTPEFEITRSEWRFGVDATATTDSSGEVNVTAKDAANLPVGSSIALTHPDIGLPTDSTSSGILDGPGSFSLEIDANGADYAIHVCEGTTGGGGGQTGKSNTIPTPSPQPPPTPSPSPPPSAPPFKAGGPQYGPVPQMPNGSCPEEFPIMREHACYRA